MHQSRDISRAYESLAGNWMVDGIGRQRNRRGGIAFRDGLGARWPWHSCSRRRWSRRGPGVRRYGVATSVREEAGGGFPHLGCSESSQTGQPVRRYSGQSRVNVLPCASSDVQPTSLHRAAISLCDPSRRAPPRPLRRPALDRSSLTPRFSATSLA